MTEKNTLEVFFENLANTVRKKAVFADGEDDTFKPEDIANILTSDRIDPTINGKFKEDLILYTPKGITGIEEVTLGSLVTTVANSAYINCSNLHTVNFLGDVKSISSKAFSGCSKLKNIDLSTVTSIGSNAFENCSNLVDINASDKLTSVGQFALKTTGWYKNTTGPVIAGRCLCGSNKVEEITITDKVITLVVTGAFSNDTKVKKITLRIGGTVGIQSFQKATALEEVTLIQNGTESVYIGIRAFDGCTKLSNFYADYVSEINQTSFSGCTNLKTIHFGKLNYNVTTACFGSCTNLTSMYIGEMIGLFNSDFFKGCSSLTEISIMNKETIPTRVFNALKSLPSYVSGKTVTLHVSQELYDSWNALLFGNESNKLNNNLILSLN
jgi:hypothetical protein